MLDVDEPFMRLFNQGMVKRFGQVMSKSAGNGVSPDELVNKQGADAGRIYEMFIGPPEEDVEWIESGLNGVVKFLHRVWRLALEPESIETSGGSRAASAAALLRRKGAQTIRNVPGQYDGLSFTPAAASFWAAANA